MNKKITIIGINYYPEDTAIGLYTTQLAEYLNKNGFDVELIAGFPYYPSWKIHKSYKSKSKFYKEIINDIPVYRYRQYVPSNPSFIKRVILLVDFTIGSFFNLFKIKKTDMVLAIVPFTSSILLGRIIAKRLKAKLWVHIQDFEFDAASEANLINAKEKKGFMFKMLFKLESYLLNKADAISTISNAMLNKLDGKSKEVTPKYLLPNWVDINTINPKTAKSHSYLNSDKFKILYSGNIGEKQDWEFFVRFVEKLKNDTEVIVVGDGSKKDWVKNKIKAYPNVHYYPPVPYKDLADLLCSADLHILFQKENVIDTVMPSKILGMMASAKPSIITGNIKSEVAEVISKSQAGFYHESTNLKEVLKSLEIIIRDYKVSKNIGINARNYVEANFSSKEILEKFTKEFKNIVSD